MSNTTYAQLFAEYTDMIAEFEEVAEQHEKNVSSLMEHVRNSIYFFNGVKLTDLISESKRGAKSARTQVKRITKSRDNLIAKMNERKMDNGLD